MLKLTYVLMPFIVLSAAANASECYMVKNLTGYTNFLQEGKSIEDGISGPVRVDITGNVAQVSVGDDQLGSFKFLNNGFYMLTGTPENEPDKLTTMEIMTINRNLKKISLIKAMNGVVLHNFNTKTEDDVSDIQMLSGDYSPCNGG